MRTGKCFVYMCKQLLGVGVLEAALVCAGDWRAQSRHEDDIRGVLLEDICESALQENHDDLSAWLLGGDCVGCPSGCPFVI